ncbi:hypothetical protein B0J14DRAFT_287961 [Halenospora varia]|nr:hypothetical protein B0J14DRAFT_287961 [Halenospora varia]
MPGSRPFSCDVCCRAFTRSENLGRHKKTHHGGAEAQSFECPKCQAAFSRRDVLKRHADRCTGYARNHSSNRPRKRARTSASIVPNVSPPEGNDDTSPHVNGGEIVFHTPEEISNLLLPTDPLINIPANEISDFMESYFTHFHPALPILHRTAVTPSTPPIMLRVVVAIGCLYAGRRKTTDDRDRFHQLSQDLWRSGGYELEALVINDRQLFRTNWVLQSWLLYTVYGNFSGDDRLVSKSRKMYRFLTDAIRELDLLHQRNALPAATLWTNNLDLSLQFDEAHVHHKWQEFIAQESLKLALYAFFFFDYHLFVSCNGRPAVSAIEFEWGLPKASPLWEADSALAWWAVLQDGHQGLGSYRLEHLREEPDMRSIMAATQALLSASPSIQLLALLAVSPFATLCIVTNLECLVKDFTRCYYQLPPNLSDPNPFHVLTQAQNSQVSAALGLIWGVTGDGPCVSCSEECKSLWHAVRIGCLSTKISLSTPDDLLVAGLVESNSTAGLATAAHLTLGDYVTTRRSGLGVNDSTIHTLGEALKVMHEMSMPHPSAAWEGPWLSIQAFRVLLVLWRILRTSTAQIQNESPPDSIRYPTHFRPAAAVIEGVVSALRIYSNSQSISSLSSDAQEAVEHLEDQYMQWMHQICDRRDVWDVGQSMTKVLEEIYDMVTE